MGEAGSSPALSRNGNGVLAAEVRLPTFCKQLVQSFAVKETSMRAPQRHMPAAQRVFASLDSLPHYAEPRGLLVSRLLFPCTAHYPRCMECTT